MKTANKPPGTFVISRGFMANVNCSHHSRDADPVQKQMCTSRAEGVNCSRSGEGFTGRKRTFTEFETDVERGFWDKTVEMEVDKLRRDVHFLKSEVSKQSSPICAEHVSCSSRGRGGGGGKRRKRTFSEFEGDQCARRSPATEVGIDTCDMGVAEEASEMLKQRCTLCAEQVNRCRSGNDCTERKDRQWAIREFDGEHSHRPPPTTDVECGSRDRTAEMEVEMLRRNVKFLACCHTTDLSRLAQDDTMVCFVIRGTDQIIAHRSVLAGVSPVFEKMFSVGMLEKKTGKVSISDASLVTMEAVMKYCYTADIAFTEQLDLDEVMHISHKYDINSLKDRCETELCNRFQNLMKITVDLSAALGMTEKVLATTEIYGLERLRTTGVKELRLRNYIVRQKSEMDTKNVRVHECHSRSSMVDDRTSPHALAKLLRLSFKFGSEDMKDGIDRLVQNLSHEEGKQVWIEMMKL